ncbi:MAG: hypothetical protein AABX39_00300, partial [Nanoarchaeota archaeon]
MNLTYKTYAWIGLTGVMLSILAVLLAFLGGLSILFSPILFFILIYTSFTLIFLSGIASVLFKWAFVDLSDRVHNAPLLVGSAILFTLNILILLFTGLGRFIALPQEISILINPAQAKEISWSLLILFVVMGSTLITTGIGFLKLRE